MRRKISLLFLCTLMLVTFAVGCSGNKHSDGDHDHDHVFGHIEGTSYESTLLGLAYEFNEDWVVLLESEILERNNFSADSIVREGNLIDEVSYVDVFAYDYDSYDNVIVNFEKCDEDLDIDTYIKEREESIQSHFESVGYTDIAFETTTVEFLGDETPCLSLSSKLEDDSIFVKYIYLTVDDYLVTVEVTSDNADRLEELVSGFYEAK